MFGQFDTSTSDGCVMVETPKGRMCVYPGEPYYPINGPAGGVISPSSATPGQVVNVQANPSLLNSPQPGTVPVDPNSGLFAQVLGILVQGATPVAQAKIAIAAQSAQSRGEAVHVPAGVAKQAAASMAMQSGQQLPVWVYWVGGVLGGLFVMTLIFGRKKK
jgi:hypothetical protein